MTRWSLTLCLALCFAFAPACGGEQATSGEDEAAESDESQETSEEESGDESAEDESEEGDELADDLEDEESSELAVGVAELALDEETTARVAAERRSIAHILVRYRGAERAPSSVTRSQEEAEARAREVLARVGDEDFAAVALEMSDDTANADHGGEMGSLERGLLPEALDDALFSMEIEEVRGPIESPLGFHVIRRMQ